MTKTISTSLLLISCLMLTACATTGTSPNNVTAENVTANNATADDASATSASEPPSGPDDSAEEVTPPEPVYRPFPEQTLYALLVAEFAAKRRQYDVALGRYLEQAHETRDAGIAARSAHMAHYMKADRAAMDAAMLWASIEQDNIEAHYLASIMLSRNHQPRTALSYMNKVAQLGGKTNFYYLAASANEVSPAVLHKLLEDFDTLISLHPDNTDILLAKSILLQQAGDDQTALKRVQQALKIETDDQRSMLLEAKLLLKLNQPKQALTRIEHKLASDPDDQRLRLQYARLLTQIDLAEAQQQFFMLAEQFPTDADLIFSLALIYRENGLFDDAERRFKQLLAMEKRRSAAHFYLGQLAERKGDLPDAIAHYQLVGEGPDFVNAIHQLMKIYLRQEHLDIALQTVIDARQKVPSESRKLYLMQSDLLTHKQTLNEAAQLLDHALTEYPGDAGLLYARSMVSEKRGDLTRMEADLRAILVTNPRSSLALNALGYVLADRTDRLDEAEQLIRQALAFQPEDPAILDSLGWVLFRRGKHSEALTYLQQAMDQFPDHEVAAHLGEVLWVTGKQKEAMQVWREALDKTPDSPVIKRTLEKLQVDLNNP